ncbi:MAG: caspase family protein [Elusimicrobia bacterium]|nr:caspase family protein [Elusimicrobiota bacterium]
MRNWKALLFPVVLFFTLTGAMLGEGGAGGGCATPGGGGGLMGSMVQQNAAQVHRGSGMRRTYEDSEADVHAAALYVLNRYSGNGWYVQDLGRSISANFHQGFVSMSQTVTLSPGLAEDSTEVESTSVGSYLASDVLVKMENDTLNYIADALAVRKASAKKRDQEPAPRDADEAPARASSSDVDKIGQFTDKERTDDFAVVVGIEKYQNVPKADYAENDAKTMQKYFQALGVPEENVIVLTGQKATRTGLAKYLEEWLPRNVTPNSRVYFYYSGHGAPDPSDGSAYLVPWDGDASFLKTSAYPVSRLYEKLGALKAKEVVVMLDSCFSGAGGRSVIAKGARPLVNIVDTAVPSQSRL